MIIKIGGTISAKQAILLIEYLETHFESEMHQKHPATGHLYLKETPDLLLFLSENKILFARHREKIDPLYTEV